MRYVPAVITTLAWGLWLGGLGAMFLFAMGLFAMGDRGVEVGPAVVTGHELAKAVNPQLFEMFARYQLVLAAAALVATFVWRLVCGSVQVNVLFVLLGISAACAAANRGYLMKKMEPLVVEGRTQSEEFRKLHATSMGLSTTQGCVLLVAGVMIPYTLVATDRRRFLKAGNSTRRHGDTEKREGAEGGEGKADF